MPSMPVLHADDVEIPREDEAETVAETQEVLDVCAEHGVGPDVQVIAIQEGDRAYDEVERGDVRFRYAIDSASLRREAT